MSEAPPWKTQAEEISRVAEELCDDMAALDDDLKIQAGESSLSDWKQAMSVGGESLPLRELSGLKSWPTPPPHPRPFLPFWDMCCFRERGCYFRHIASTRLV